MKKSLLMFVFALAFAGADALAQDAAPVIQATRTEEQMVAETICPAMQDEATYKAKGMAVYKKIVAGNDGWVFRTSTDYRTDFSLLPQTLKYMKRMQDVFASQGTTFVFLIPPTRGLAQGEHATGKDDESIKFQKDLKAARASYLAMIKTMQGAGINVVGFSELTTGTAYSYKRDHHWNPDGAKLAAERTAAFLKTKPVYSTLKKTPYTTKDTGIYDYSGPIGEVLLPICKLMLMTEKAHRYVTEQTTKAADSGALFDEQGFPEVALVGTSNSSSDPSVANFEGFLKEALGADVYNASIIGAGIDAPILAYLNSKAYREHKPKVVIWEAPGYYNHNFMHSRIYRQAIPAILGDCTTANVAERKASAVNSANETVISGLAGKNLQGSNYYLTLRFSSAVKKPININLNYKNWADTYKASRPPRFPYDGEYYMLLKDTKSGPLDSVTVKLPDDLVGKTLEARVCKMPASIATAKTPAAKAVKK